MGSNLGKFRIFGPVGESSESITPHRFFVLRCDCASVFLWEFALPNGSQS